MVAVAATSVGTRPAARFPRSAAALPASAIPGDAAATALPRNHVNAVTSGFSRGTPVVPVGDLVVVAAVVRFPFLCRRIGSPCRRPNEQNARRNNNAAQCATIRLMRRRSSLESQGRRISGQRGKTTVAANFRSLISILASYIVSLLLPLTAAPVVTYLQPAASPSPPFSGPAPARKGRWWGYSGCMYLCRHARHRAFPSVCCSHPGILHPWRHRFGSRPSCRCHCYWR